jgi:hypothetical protein
VLIAVKQSGIDLLITICKSGVGDGPPECRGPGALTASRAAIRQGAGYGDNVLPQMPVCESDLNVASALPN